MYPLELKSMFGEMMVEQHGKIGHCFFENPKEYSGPTQIIRLYLGDAMENVASFIIGGYSVS
jgi:hypothetical protein